VKPLHNAWASIPQTHYIEISGKNYGFAGRMVQVARLVLTVARHGEHLPMSDSCPISITGGGKEGNLTEHGAWTYLV
jgi:hypothetical protein